jgi:4-carboxymuconolactone decarboxylase
MTHAERALVALSAAVGTADAARLDAAIDAARAAVAPDAVEEALLQSYLFVGYPAALRALARWRERTQLSAGPPSGDDAALWAVRGADVCERVYGGQYARLRANVAALHPDLERWMVEEGYGKVLGRPGLALRVRELCIIALLVQQDAPQQLYAHLRGALNVGASMAEVEEAVAIAAAVAVGARREAALRVWASVRERRRADGPDDRGRGADPCS